MSVVSGGEPSGDGDHCAHREAGGGGQTEQWNQIDGGAGPRLGQEAQRLGHAVQRFSAPGPVLHEGEDEIGIEGAYAHVLGAFNQHPAKFRAKDVAFQGLSGLIGEGPVRSRLIKPVDGGEAIFQGHPTSGFLENGVSSLHGPSVLDGQAGMW